MIFCNNIAGRDASYRSRFMNTASRFCGKHLTLTRKGSLSVHASARQQVMRIVHACLSCQCRAALALKM